MVIVLNLSSGEVIKVHKRRVELSIKNKERECEFLQEGGVGSGNQIESMCESGNCLRKEE